MSSRRATPPPEPPPPVVVVANVPVTAFSLLIVTVPVQAPLQPEKNVELAEDATDRGLEPGERPLSFEVLVGLAAVVAALGDVAARGAGR
jgi:hypothetical protein